MEWLATFLIVLCIVLLVGGLFSAVGARGPWPGMIWFFVILFIATLAVGSWTWPVGPVFWGAPWLTFLIVAVFISLLIAAATPDYGYRSRRAEERPLERDVDVVPGEDKPKVAPGSETPEVAPERELEPVPAATAIGVTVWIFLAFAASILILGLLLAPGVVPVP